MAGIVNFRSRRKARDRLAREKEAEANRAVHGMSKAERVKGKRLKDQAARQLEGHWLDHSKSHND